MIRRPRLGKRVAAIRFDAKRCKNALDVGRAVARKWHGAALIYAVQFDGGRIELFDATELFTKWEKGGKK